MITKVIINDNTQTPLSHLHKLDAFKNGKEYDFKPGINIIIGRNGCGKSTLMNLIALYTLCYKKNVTKLPDDTIEMLNYFEDFGDDDEKFKDGVDVMSDYCGVVYNYITQGDVTKGNALSSVENLSLYMNNSVASTGESMINSLGHLLDLLFKNKDVQFPIEKIKSKIEYCNDLWQERFKNMLAYYKRNQVKTHEEDFEFTLLLDEPDRNLDIVNIDNIYPVLSYRRKKTQVIAVIHNPVLIYKLSKLDYINFIELTDNYLEDIKKVFKKL